MPPKRRQFAPALSLHMAPEPTPPPPQTMTLSDLTAPAGEAIKPEDIDVLEELGAGAGGSVHRVSLFLS